jgi:hypothetical protein
MPGQWYRAIDQRKYFMIYYNENDLLSLRIEPCLPDSQSNTLKWDKSPVSAMGPLRKGFKE